MKPQVFFITLAVTLLSFVVGVLGAFAFSGFFGDVALVVAALINLFAIAGYPFLIRYPNAASVAFFAVPAIIVALVFGFCFIGWGYGALYALGALVVYLGFGASAAK